MNSSIKVSDVDVVAAYLSSQTKNTLVAMTQHIEGQAGDYARLPKSHFEILLGKHDLEVLQEAAKLVSSKGDKAEAITPPCPPAPKNVPTDAAAQLALALKAFMPEQPAAAPIDESQVRAIVGAQIAEAFSDAVAEVKAHMDKNCRTVEVKLPSGELKAIGRVHTQFEQLLKAVNAKTANGRLNVWLSGPAGSGKTSAAEKVAEALGLSFYFNGAIDTEYKLLGFTDAQGRIVSRPFREAYEKGGVYLFDEIDASLPGALLAFNAATANGYCDFPDGMIKRHPDCVIIAAANTIGMGANSDYVGRNKQDGAFLDRFVMIQWGVDEELEMQTAPDQKWCKFVQGCRAKAKDKGLKVIISPRATYYGAALLEAGLPYDVVCEMALRKGMTDDQWKNIQ